MGRLRVFLLLGLALLVLAVPALAAELPADVENALPRDAGRLLDGVEQWDAGSLTDGVRSIWDHLQSDAADMLRRQTRSAASILLVVLLCGLVDGFRKSAGDSTHFLSMAGALAVAALTAGSTADRCSAPPRTASRRQSPYRTVGIVCSNSSMLAISAFMFSIQAPSVGKGHGWAGFLA